MVLWKFVFLLLKAIVMNPIVDAETNAAAGRVKTRAQTKAGTEKPETEEEIQEQLNATNPRIVDPAVMDFITGNEKLSLEERFEQQQRQANNISRELIKFKADTDSRLSKVENQVTNLEGKVETGMRNLESKIEESQQKVVGEVGSLMENMFRRFVDSNTNTGRGNEPVAEGEPGPSRRSVNFTEPIGMSTRRTSQRLTVNGKRRIRRI